MRRPSTSLYLNRELGQLEFNRRVLALAADPRVPALERLRYLCIVDSNLDEFFEIRVAGLKAKTESRGAPDTDGMPIRQVFEAVGRKTRELMTLQYEILNTQVLPLLAWLSGTVPDWPQLSTNAPLARVTVQAAASTTWATPACSSA